MPTNQDELDKHDSYHLELSWTSYQTEKDLKRENVDQFPFLF